MKKKFKSLGIFVSILILIYGFSIPVLALENDIIVNNDSILEQFEPISTTDTISVTFEDKSTPDKNSVKAALPMEVTIWLSMDSE